MKYWTLLLLLASFTANAQKETSVADTVKKGKHTLTVGQVGSSEDKDTADKKLDVVVGILDIGINSLRDETDYNSAAAQNFLRVPSEFRNENLFSLKVAKSVNVNIYPVVVKYRMVRTKKQRLYASAGLGFQVYNFRFSKPVTYANTTEPMIGLDSVNHITKNKIAITYLSVPLMITAKTRMAKDLWLVYGLGVSGGFRINSLQKQISDEKGTQKNRDQFNFNNFNACVNAELGIDGYVRLFASYQLTNLYENALTQYPYVIGVRFFGI